MRKAIAFQRVAVVAVFIVGAGLGPDLLGQVAGHGPPGGVQRQFANQIPGPLMLQPVRPDPGPGPYWYGHPRGGWWAGDWGTPWYIPMTRTYKGWPVPQYEYPKLGLQYNYPYAYQMGIQMPPDPDEPVEWDGSSSGALGRGQVREDVRSPAVLQGIGLMQKGRFADAGRLFAGELQDDEASPGVYLLIAEALFAVGKYRDADLVLRVALETSQGLDFLDQADLPGKFPSPEALNDRLGALQTKSLGETPLLAGVLCLLGGSREKGLEILRGPAREDRTAQRVYLHFIGDSFGAPNEAKDDGADNAKAPAKNEEAPKDPPQEPGKPF